jgi:hypothetical protein
VLLLDRWPVARIWQIHQDDYAGEFSVDFDAGPERILISRPLFRVEVTAFQQAPSGSCRMRSAASIAQSLDAALARAGF